MRRFSRSAFEFWNYDHRRYTLFFDPGRVKQEILPNELLGRPLTAGEPYMLVVDASWPDANGVPMKEAFRKEFTVGPADTTRLAPRVTQAVGWRTRPTHPPPIRPAGEHRTPPATSDTDSFDSLSSGGLGYLYHVDGRASRASSSPSSFPQHGGPVALRVR